MQGFVYIWYDRKHKRFYVGSHWGAIDDGYICSSSWMLRAYKRRPQDFRRRILKIVHDRSKLLETEQFYLSMIKDEEIKIRYYNLTNKIRGHWSHDHIKNSVISYKISEANKRKKLSIETKNKIAESNRGKKKPLRSEEHRKKLSASHKGKVLTDDHRKKLSEANKGKSKDNGRTGSKHSDSTKIKFENLIWITNGFKNKRINKSEIIPIGWNKGRSKIK